MDKKKLEELMELAQRVGKAYAAPDVFELLRPVFAEVGVTLIECQHLEEGTIVAAELPTASRIDEPGQPPEASDLIAEIQKLRKELDADSALASARIENLRNVLESILAASSDAARAAASEALERDDRLIAEARISED